MDTVSELVQLLLNAKSDVNARSEVSADRLHCVVPLSGLSSAMLQFQGTALHIAANDGHSESVQLLLNAKSDANARNKVSAH